ncbi:MAG: alanine racemase [Bacteroidales bacterium]|nr:alanine racemase [Bacteroidales bacterium]
MIDLKYPVLEVSRENLKYNIDHFRSKLKPSTKVLVLLKANAYGAGGIEVGRMMGEIGVDYGAVAFVSKGVELRRSGIDLPMILLTWSRTSIDDIVKYELEPGVTDMRSLILLRDSLSAAGIRNYPVHIKLDTGMHRVGFMEKDLDEMIAFFRSDDTMQVKSIYSHLAGADDQQFDSFTLGQCELFDGLSKKVADGLGYMPMRHLLNTAGVERFAEKYPQYQYDMVRLGIGTYGAVTIPGEDVRPVLSLKTEVIQVKHLDVSDGTVGYSRKGVITRPSDIATIPLGYADGVDRRLGNGAIKFLVNGHRAPTIGNICMDAFMLDVTGLDVKPGDEVTIFGEEPRVEEICDLLGTIPHEVITRVSQRVNRAVIK